MFNREILALETLSKHLYQDVISSVQALTRDNFTIARIRHSPG